MDFCFFNYEYWPNTVVVSFGLIKVYKLPVLDFLKHHMSASSILEVYPEARKVFL